MNRSGIITLGIMTTIIVVVVLYVFLRDQSLVQKNKETPAAVALLPEEDQSFTTLSGESTSVADSFGDVIVVSSWASWCPQCTGDFSKLNEVAAEFKDKDVHVYAVNRGEDTYSAERYLQTIEKPEHVEFILDPSDHFFKNSSGYAMPETIVYDKKGKIVLHQRGELKPDEVKDVLVKLLE